MKRIVFRILSRISEKDLLEKLLEPIVQYYEDLGIELIFEWKISHESKHKEELKSKKYDFVFSYFTVTAEISIFCMDLSKDVDLMTGIHPKLLELSNKNNSYAIPFGYNVYILVGNLDLAQMVFPESWNTLLPYKIAVLMQAFPMINNIEFWKKMWEKRDKIIWNDDPVKALSEGMAKNGLLHPVELKKLSNTCNTKFKFEGVKSNFFGIETILIPKSSAHKDIARKIIKFLVNLDQTDLEEKFGLISSIKGKEASEKIKRAKDCLGKDSRCLMIPTMPKSEYLKYIKYIYWELVQIIRNSDEIDWCMFQEDLSHFQEEIDNIKQGKLSQRLKMIKLE